MAESALLFELGLVLGVAALLAIVGRWIRQPTIIAYLIAGILVGPAFFNILQSRELIEIFAHLGVTFLLFIVGISLDFSVLKQVGKVSLLFGLGQVIITGSIGYVLALLIGFSPLASLYIAAALAFSSTVFVTNLLAEKRERGTLHGRLSSGILIVQDFVGVLALLIIPLIGTHRTFGFAFEHFGIGVGLILGVFALSHIFGPRLLTITAKSQEVLFLTSIGWAFLIAMVFAHFDLPVELGALIAGMSLASSKFSVEIGGKISNLREFFVIIHLIFFGGLLVQPITGTLVLQAVLLSALVLIGNPLIIMTLMKLKGYDKRSGFLTGISIAQISEFSLILVYLGYSLGVVPRVALSLTILVALITIGLSSYAIHYSRPLYHFFAPMLGVFNGHGAKKRLGSHHEKKYEIILFGYDRIGFNLLKSLQKAKRSFLVVDYDPDVIANLQRKKIPCVYGDANDMEFLHELNLRSAKTVISTIPNVETNILIYRQIPTKTTVFIATAHDIGEARILYDEGADYVIMPHFLGGHFMGSLLGRSDFDRKLLTKHRARHHKELKEREFEGHTHPKHDASKK